MSGSYSFEGFTDFAPGAERFMTVFMVVYLIILAFALIYAAVVYVLQSLGLYTIAKRRCIHHSWLAWIPIGNMWLLGSISDQYQFVAKGRVRNRRKVLLGLLIAVYALLIVAMVILVSSIITSVMAEGASGTITATGSMMGAVGFYFVGWLLAVVAMVFTYIAYYDLFASCNPNNAVVFLVLSIFFNFLLPFFIFACRKKDEGMPPRRVVVPAAPWTPVQDAPQPEVAAEPDGGFPEVTEDDIEPEE